MIVSGDVMIRNTQSLQPIPDADVVCYGLWLGPETARNHGVFVSSRQTPSVLKCMLQKPSVEKAWRTFYAEAAQGGVLLHPNHHWYVGMSHTEQDIDETLNVCETALWKVKEER